jgi:hypothetical protein
MALFCCPKKAQTIAEMLKKARKSLFSVAWILPLIERPDISRAARESGG